jgi:hypothetical protein
MHVVLMLDTEHRTRGETVREDPDLERFATWADASGYEVVDLTEPFERHTWESRVVLWVAPGDHHWNPIASQLSH